MRALLRWTLTTTAALVAAVVLFVGFTLPPGAVRLEGAPTPGVVYGAYHVHSTRSDGSGSQEDIAAAAASASIAYVIFTDHGDATRRPDPPRYVQGVLCIDAVEISTDDGHVVALGLGAPSPYPLAGTMASVVEDIHRQGGWAVIAHPDSPKTALRFRGRGAPFDGLEWINADTEWRDESGSRLVLVAARSLVRGPEAIVSLFSRPARSLDRWDAAARQRGVTGLSAADAHANISSWDADEGEPRPWLMLAKPSYAQMFRAVTQAAVIDAPLTGEPASDAAAILTALRAGRAFSVVTGLAGPASLDFTGTRGEFLVRMGDRLPAGEPVTFSASVPQASGAAIELLRDGQPLAAGLGRLVHSAGAPGVYRVEVSWPGAAVPWLVSNPISIGGEPPTPPGVPPAAPGPLVGLPPDSTWTTEHDPASTARLSTEGKDVTLEYGLGGGPPASQFAAAVVSVKAEQGVERIEFVAHADRPMRISVQARLPRAPGGVRWHRSVYLDQTPRRLVVRLADLEPIGPAGIARPVVASVGGVLFVVDTVNTPTGAKGTVWISEVSLGLGETGGR